MLARTVGLRTQALHPTFRPRICSQVLARSYALSRHEQRPAGGGRTRPKLSRRETPNEQSPYGESQSYKSSGYEENPPSERSPLWEASQRPPASNPEDGLRRLLLGNERLVITRQIEMLNIFMGFEQSNRYAITNEHEEPLGYIAEEPRGILSVFSRQILRTHRPFRAIVMDAAGSPILWIRRPFAWINSRMFVQQLKDLDNYTTEGEPILDTFAEVQQRWHLWRRRYDLFLRHKGHRILSLASDPQPEPEVEPDTFNQFATIDEGFLAWHFALRDAQGAEIASINRAFRGFGREILTDTGQYFVNFTPSPPNPLEVLSGAPPRPVVNRDLTLKERALILAIAVNVDFDYFSRHSEGGGGLGFPLFWGSWGSD